MKTPITRLFFCLLFLLCAPMVSADTVDLNRADATALARVLSGIGPVKAQAIVAYREANGPFKRVEDLRRVPGIGTALVKANQSQLSVGAADPVPVAKKAQVSKPANPAKVGAVQRQ